MLSKHSEFFKDMFKLPQPADAEMVDNCASVIMSDTVQDIECVLRLLFDKSVFKFWGSAFQAS